MQIATKSHHTSEKLSKNFPRFLWVNANISVLATHTFIYKAERVSKMHLYAKMLPNTCENHSYNNDENERVETIDQQRELTVKQVVVRGGRRRRQLQSWHRWLILSSSEIHLHANYDKCWRPHVSTMFFIIMTSNFNLCICIWLNAPFPPLQICLQLAHKFELLTRQATQHSIKLASVSSDDSTKSRDGDDGCAR